MNRTTLPAPPNPATFKDPAEWSKAAYLWMAKVKGQIETDSAANVGPIGPFVVGSYTATNTITGTDAISNFVATLIAAMQVKGITSASGGGVN